MRVGLLILVLLGSVLAIGSTAPGPARPIARPLPTTIVGWNPSLVMARLDRNGYQCRDETLVTGGLTQECSTSAGDTVSRILTVTGPHRMVASMVVATVARRSGSLSRVDRAFLASIAGAPYRGSNTRAAESWLRSAEGFGNRTLTLGYARLALNVSHDRLVWTLTEVALAQPVDSCPCHSQ